MRRRMHSVLLLMLLPLSMTFAGQDPDFNVASLTSKGYQAHQTVLRASIFSLGPVGYAAHVSETELALRLLLEEKEAIAALRDVLAHATLEGKMYALYGLYIKDREIFKQAIKQYRAESGEEKMAGTQSGCIVMQEDVKTVLAKMELGQYDLLFGASWNRK